jgi:hypothetical protein
MQMMYRSFQVNWLNFSNVFGAWMLPAYYMVNTNMVTILYTVIKYNASLNTIVLSIGCIIALDVGLGAWYFYQLAVDLAKTSAEYGASHLRNAKNPLAIDTNFWKSCFPLKAYIGDQFSIVSQNFCLEVFCSFILTTVLSLLLTF